jgi:hypothetical protein
LSTGRCAARQRYQQGKCKAFDSCRFHWELPFFLVDWPSLAIRSALQIHLPGIKAFGKTSLTLLNASILARSPKLSSLIIFATYCKHLRSLSLSRLEIGCTIQLRARSLPYRAYNLSPLRGLVKIDTFCDRLHGFATFSAPYISGQEFPGSSLVDLPPGKLAKPRRALSHVRIKPMLG